MGNNLSFAGGRCFSNDDLFGVAMHLGDPAMHRVGSRSRWRGNGDEGTMVATWRMARCSSDYSNQLFLVYCCMSP